jgi:hypothetical protein
MARPRYPRQEGPLPPPLPPETRTVGQLVAESLRLYGRRFWASVALGVPAAALTVLAAQFDDGSAAQIGFVAAAGAVLLTASFVAAVTIVGGGDVTPRRAAVAFAAGVLVWLPVPLLALLFVLPALLWLGLVGLAVPVAAREGADLRAAFVRAAQLGRADYVHAVGSLATLAITVFLCQSVLFFLLRDQGDQTLQWAAFLANLVVSPILFLGAALLYEDQAARLAAGRPRRRRTPDAALHPALDADGAGPADAERESRPPARREP